jgi:uncharacterized protein (DUF2141 family)
MRKKRISTTIVFILSIQLMFAQTGSGTLTLTVTGLNSNNGKIIASIFKNPEGFPHEKGKSVQRVKASINNDSSVLVFNNLPYDYYAIGIIHDENNNDNMDFGLFYIPKEGYGASNNAKGHRGPPDFKDAKFYFDSANNKIKIHINY